MIPIKDFPGYLIDDDGNVYSEKYNKFLVPLVRKNSNHVYVRMFNEIGEVSVSIPKLMLKIFKGIDADTNLIDYSDGNKRNCNINNIIIKDTKMPEINLFNQIKKRGFRLVQKQGDGIIQDEYGNKYYQIYNYYAYPEAQKFYYGSSDGEKIVSVSKFSNQLLHIKKNKAFFTISLGKGFDLCLHESKIKPFVEENYFKNSVQKKQENNIKSTSDEIIRRSLTDVIKSMIEINKSDLSAKYSTDTAIIEVLITVTPKAKSGLILENFE